MGNQSSEINIVIMVGTVVFLLFAGFILAYMMIYWKRKHLQEVEKMKLNFNEEILKSQLEIQEQTFTTISQEIHDNVGQLLSLAKVQANIIDQSETTDKAVLAELRDNIGKAMTDLRDMAKSLNSDHLRLLSLKDLIVPELARMQRSGLLATAITEEGTTQPIDQQKKLILFRIIQEALHNVIKHAAAENLSVQLLYMADAVEIKIVDDGKGFDVDTVIATDGLGLHNMMSRAVLLKGKAYIKSRPGEGAAIIITIPYA